MTCGILALDGEACSSMAIQPSKIFSIRSNTHLSQQAVGHYTSDPNSAPGVAMEGSEYVLQFLPSCDKIRLTEETRRNSIDIK